MTDESLEPWDVLVIGGGNAALCAAITARQAGASVIVIEAAPEFYRGGNTRHTRNMRCAHAGTIGFMSAPYEDAEFLDDLLKVTGGKTDIALAQLMVRQSRDLLPWIVEQGVRFQPSLSGTLSLDRTNAFFLGGGRSLLNSLYRTAARLGIKVCYETEAVALNLTDGRFTSADVQTPSGEQRLQARSLVAAAGGYEANLDWLRQSWGEAADNFLIRGSPYNQGSVLRMLIEAGMETAGDPGQCHAVAIDARAPRFDGGIVTRLDCVIFGIVVNRDGERFYDEGEDIWPKRYAVWGRLVAQQPDQQAYILIDNSAINQFMPSLYPPVTAPTIRELAGLLSLDPDRLCQTVDTYNKAVQPGSFNPAMLDDCHTQGLTPPKSHWARKIEQPPYFAWPVRPGITFTYLGLRVDQDARVLPTSASRGTNIFAAGEIMAGNVLGQGYAAGIGMTIGGVFGRIAGRAAAAEALHKG